MRRGKAEMCFLFYSALKVKVAKRIVFKSTVNFVTFGFDNVLLFFHSFFFSPTTRPVLKAPHCRLYVPWLWSWVVIGGEWSAVRWPLQRMPGRRQELAVRREKADGKVLPLGMLLSNREVQTSKSEVLVPRGARGRSSRLSPSLI